MKFIIGVIATILILLILLLPSGARAVSFTFHNHANQTVLYYIWWIDHPHDFAGPLNICGGELSAGKKHRLSYEYPEGAYFFQVVMGENVSGDVYQIPADVTAVLITITDNYIELLPFVNGQAGI